MLATDSICSEITIQPGRYNFGDFIIDQLFDEPEKQYVIITSSGLTKLPDDFGEISKTSGRDYDNDKLADISEINCDLVTFESDGTISYPSFDEIVKQYDGLFYVEKGLERLKKDLDKTLPNYMQVITVMPIKSDPLSVDGDGDKVVDSVDLRPLKYIPNFENVELDTDAISWYYTIRMDMIPGEDEYGNKITGENRENTITEYYFKEYISPRNSDITFNEWAQSTYGLSEKEIYLQKSYAQIVEGNGYEGEVTLLGTAGSIIVGISPFGVICDARDLTCDIAQFDKSKGIKQGKEWYLQAIPDVIGAIPLIGDIGKGAGEALSQLSKTDASKVVNYAIKQAVDESGNITKNSDEIVAGIKEEAEEIIQYTNYSRIDDTIDTVGQTSSEQSVYIAKKTLDEETEIIEEGKIFTDSDDIFNVGKNNRADLKPNITYKTASGQIYTTGANGEIISVSGSLNKAKGTRNTYAQSIAGRESRLDTDDGGHLIATIFGGDGSLANLVPMDGNLNKGAWKSMENAWAKLLDMKNVTDVKVDIKMSYLDDNKLRPTNFKVKTFVTLENGDLLDYTTDFENSSNQVFKLFDILKETN